MRDGQRFWYILLAVGAVSLLLGMWGGLLRMGWPWPAVTPVTVAAHGALMVCGFLGTVIGLERAVALRMWWVYLAPLLGAVATVALLAGAPTTVGALGMVAAAAMLVAALALIVHRHPALYTVIMLVGGAAWLVGNVLWLAGFPIYRVVLFWLAFLVLTVAGERLELTRFTRTSPLRRETFVGAIGVLLGGVALSIWSFDGGVRVAGLGMLLLAVWLLRYDIALRTIRRAGVTRFIAIALLSGYVWLGVGGLLEMGVGAASAGYLYDAALHAVFVGFIMSMIFGHALIIIPALTRRAIPFRPILYVPLALLDLSLVLRVAGDLAAQAELRMAGGLLNAASIVLFIGLVAYCALVPAPARTERVRDSGARRDAV